MARASLEKEPREVAAMFDGVAEKYDRTNVFLALGQDRRWRIKTTRALELRRGEKVLDVAAGTGVSTVELASTGAYAVAADFSVGMLRRGRHRGVPMVGADAMRLPFADEAFDAVAISFGLRNTADPGLVLREMARVTKPGGRLVICEFSTPRFWPFRLGHRIYLKIIPAVARRMASNPDAYVYLMESIPDWPKQRELAEMVNANGWGDVAWRNLMFGAVALHIAVKPR